MAFDVAAARNAGKSDAEIADYLGSIHRFDVTAARQAGKTDTEIADYLSSRNRPASPRLSTPTASQGTGGTGRPELDLPAPTVPAAPKQPSQEPLWKQTLKDTHLWRNIADAILPGNQQQSVVESQPEILNQAQPTVAKADPIDMMAAPALRKALRAEFDASDDEHRAQMADLPGISGQVIKAYQAEKGSKQAALDLAIKKQKAGGGQSFTGNPDDASWEARAARLTVDQGMPWDAAVAVAKRAARRGVPVGQESAYDATLTKAVAAAPSTQWLADQAAIEKDQNGDFTDYAAGRVKDLTADALKVLPTAAQTFAQTASMLTGGAVGARSSRELQGVMENIDQNVGTAYKRQQASDFAAINADDKTSIGDSLMFLLKNPNLFADQAITTVGSSIMPGAAAGFAAKAAKANALARGLTEAEATLAASRAATKAVLASNALMNGADTFQSLEGQPLESRYAGAMVSATMSMLVGKVTEGGAEGAIARKLIGDIKAGDQTAIGKALRFLETGGKEGIQESGEEIGNIAGEVTGGNQAPTLTQAGKRVGQAGIIGAAVGGGAEVATLGVHTPAQAQQEAIPQADDTMASPPSAVETPVQAQPEPPVSDRAVPAEAEIAPAQSTVTAPEPVSSAPAADETRIHGQPQAGGGRIIDADALTAAFSLDDQGTVDAAKATRGVRNQVKKALEAGTPVYLNGEPIQSAEGIKAANILDGTSKIQIGGNPPPVTSKPEGGDSRGQGQEINAGQGRQEALLTQPTVKAETTPESEKSSALTIEPGLDQKVKKAQQERVTIKPDKEGYTIMVDGKPQLTFTDLDRAVEERDALKKGIEAGIEKEQITVPEAPKPREKTPAEIQREDMAKEKQAAQPQAEMAPASAEQANGKTTVKLYRGVANGRDATSTSDTESGALFYSPLDSVAEKYAGEGGQVVGHDVTFNNLLSGRTLFDVKKSLGLPKMASTRRVIETAREKGYDGLKFSSTDGVEYVHLPDVAKKAEIHEAAHEAATSPLNDRPQPTDAQKEAGNYKKGHVQFDGLDITIENPIGSTRSGADGSGKKWSVDMTAHYGYLKRSEGADGDQVDVYIADNAKEGMPVYVFDQHNLDGSFDEHKAIVGADSEATAKSIYDAHFSDKSGSKRRRSVTVMSADEFKKWATEGDTSNPLVNSSPVKTPVETGEKPAVSTEESIAIDRAKGKTREQFDGWLRGRYGRAKAAELKASGQSEKWYQAANPSAQAEADSSSRTVTEYPIAPRDEWHGEGTYKENGGRLVQMSPDEYLSQVRPLKMDEESRENIDILKKHILDGKTLDPLLINKNGKEDGRHRAVAAKELGIKTVPVIDYRQENVAATKPQIGDKSVEPEKSLVREMMRKSIAQEGNAIEGTGWRLIDDSNEYGNKVMLYAPSTGELAKFTVPSKAYADRMRVRVKAEAWAHDNAIPLPEGPTGELVVKPMFKKPETSNKETTADKIEDFGEKLEGARKDYAAKLREALDADIGAVPLSESWPEPDYQKLLKDGSDPWAVGFMHAARDEIPTKPQRAWKLQGWIGQVKLLRDTAEKIASGQLSVQSAKKIMDDMPALHSIRDRISLYEAVGHDKSLKGIRVVSGQYSVFKGVAYNPSKVIWSVEHNGKNSAMSTMPSLIGYGDTKEAAIEAFKKTWMETSPKQDEKRAITFEIYSRRSDKSIFIGKKIGKNTVTIKDGFADVKAARAYLQDHHDDLVSILERMKDLPGERRGENSPRVGVDHRNGADVTPQQFSETFGFRGVQFGNYVEGARRQNDLNESYDALMDLAGLLGVPPKSLSLNGELGLAFGARGKGGKNPAKAHYERDHVVINLTKNKGAGSLAHEWFHGLDNYFARRSGQKHGFATLLMKAPEGMRPEVFDAFKGIVRTLNGSDMMKRSFRLDQTRSEPYWGTIIEMGARAFEAHIIAKLQDQSMSNDYLANIVSQQYWDAERAIMRGPDATGEKPSDYPYPTEAEMPAIRAAFDHFFQTVETRETESGIEFNDLAVGDNQAPIFHSALTRAAQKAKVTTGTGSQWLATLRNMPGVKAEEIDATDLEQFLGDRKGITKQQVVDYLNSNGVQVTETLHGGRSSTIAQQNHDRLVVELTAKGYTPILLDNAGLALEKDGHTWTFDEAEIDWVSDDDAPEIPLSVLEIAEPLAELRLEMADDGRRMGSFEHDDDETRYGKYTLPGGTNYRELLLTLPEQATEIPLKWERQTDDMLTADLHEGRIAVVVYDSKHPENGATLNTSDEEGNSFFDETQYPSIEAAKNAAQTLVKERGEDIPGYRSSHWNEPNVLAHIRFDERTDADGKRVMHIAEVQSDWHQQGRKYGYLGTPRTAEQILARGQSVPDAPFKTTWPELAMKRAIRYAAENGFDRITWDTGETNADRYDLSKQINIIRATRTMQGAYRIEARTHNNAVALDDVYQEEKLPDVIGKDLAKKIVNQKDGLQVYSGVDLKVGGEGMRAFYDKIMPTTVGKLIKKWGGKVESSSLFGQKGGIIRVYGKKKGGWQVRTSNTDAGFVSSRDTREEAEAALVDFNKRQIAVHGFDITPEMREYALKEGMPLFDLRADREEAKSSAIHKIIDKQPAPPPVSLSREIDSLRRKLEAGKISKADFVARIEAIRNQMMERNYIKKMQGRERVRGSDFIRQRLLEAKRTGLVSAELADFTEWFVLKNPSLVDDLGISIQTPSAELKDSSGAYMYTNRIMKLMVGKAKDTTAVHETLHHMERLMPPAMQDAIRKEYWRHVYDAAEKANKEGNEKMAEYLANAMKFNMFKQKDAADKMKDALFSGDVPASFYQFWNPSEFWAVNMTTLLSNRYVVRDSIWGKIRQWMREAVEHFKRFFGKASQSPLINALDQLVNNPSGAFKSDTMLSGLQVRTYMDKQLRDDAETKSSDLAVPGEQKNWNVTEPTATMAKLRESIRYDYVDKFKDARDVVKAIEQFKGDKVSDAQNIDRQLDTLPGRIRERIDRALYDDFRPIFKKMSELGLKREEVEEFLHYQHAPERNETIAARNLGNPDMQDGGSGKTAEQIAAYNDSLTPERRAKFEQVEKLVRQFIDKTNQTLVEYGMESQATMDLRSSAWDKYVPLHRADYEGDQIMGMGQGISIRGSDSRAAIGSKKEVVNILAHVMRQREAAIVRGEENAVSKGLYDLAKDHPNSTFWKVDEIPIKRTLGSDGQVMSYPDPTYKSKPNIIVHRERADNNKIVERALVFNDRNPTALRMAMSLKGLDTEQLGSLITSAGKFSRWISSINTQWNPVFGIFNYKRDVQEAIANLTTTEIRHQKAKVLRYSIQSMRGILVDARAEREGKHPSSSWSQWMERTAMAGGLTGYRDLHASSQDYADQLHSAMQEFSHGRARKAAEYMKGIVEDMNTMFESAVRVAAFRTAIEDGHSEAIAAQIAKNITINFNRRGRKGVQMNALYSFSNAIIQGASRNWKTLTGPAGKTIVSGCLLMGMAQAFVLAAAGFGSDEPPTYEKNNFLIIPMKNGKYLKWTLPQGLRWIISMGRIAMEAVLHKDVTAGEAAGRIGSVVADAYNPMGNATIAQTLVPTALDIPVALIENRDFAGNPIAWPRDDRGAEPGFSRAKDSASPLGTALAYGINRATGGSKYARNVSMDSFSMGQLDLASPTPDQVDYVIGQLLGGPGREIQRFWQTGQSYVKKDDLPISKMPLINRTYGNTNERAAERSRFYQLVEKAKQYNDEQEGRAKDTTMTREDRVQSLQDYRASNEDAAFSRQITAANEMVRKLRAGKRKAAEANAPYQTLQQFDTKISEIIHTTLEKRKEIESRK